jgi:lipoprotein-releasing system permease protein
MNFPFLLARRYLLAKKSHNAINIVAWISVLGVATGTFALVVVLSVFNGFDSLIRSLYNSFDPDIKVSLAEGKFFDATDLALDQIRAIKGVKAICPVLEENALLKNGNNQYICTLKGIDNSFQSVSGIDSMMVDGKLILNDTVAQYAVAGQGVAYYLGINLKSFNPTWIYLPSRNEEISLDPERAFQRRPVIVSGIFSVESEYDSKYFIVSIGLARELLSLPKGMSTLEVGLKPEADANAVQQQIEQIAGKKFVVKNRLQQQELFYKIMKSERWAIFFILTFILLVASVNIIGSLTMLIIEKKNEMITYRSLGMSIRQIKHIFLFEGWLISLAGAITGILIGLFICWLQMQYGLVQLHGTGAFIIKAYPVEIRISDILLVFFTVSAIGFAASWYPVRYISKNLFLSNENTTTNV